MRISPRRQDVMLGFATGVMLAASAFSLIVQVSTSRARATASSPRRWW
jgi:zinc transporter ZupT